MKTKIVVGGLLVVLMLVTLPILTASKNETTAVTISNEKLVKETPWEETPQEVKTVKQITKEDTTEEETTPRDETPKKTEHFDFAYVRATFSPLNEWDFDYTNGNLFFTNIMINSKDDSLTTSLKINGNTIVQRNTPVKIEIETMSVLAFRPRMTAYVALNPSYRIVLWGFASDITVTY